MSSPHDGFLEYHEPSIISLLTLISFFIILCFAEWSFDKICGAGLVGQIVAGMLYGIPVGNILLQEWQETFVALGYLGLILIIFEGGLTMRLDLMRENFFLSLCATAVGILTPIALCFALLYTGFSHGALETFIVAAALSSTSIGTTFVVLKGAATDIDFSVTRVGVVLTSAALFDDICGLIMVSIIQNLAAFQTGENVNIGWLIGRPVVASICIGLVPPLLAKFVVAPPYRHYLEPLLGRFGAGAFMMFAVMILCAFITVASYVGASVLFGAFMAGTFLSALPDGSGARPAVDAGEARDLRFAGAFERYASKPQQFILQPLFFSSIGFSIPFTRLWTAEAVWKGLTFSVLMFIGKLAVGICIPLCTLFSSLGTKARTRTRALRATWFPSLLLGCGMVARGEIGLLIIQIGLNQTPFLSEKVFIIAVWAIVLNTVVGPLMVGVLVRLHGIQIAQDQFWGTRGQMPNEEDASTSVASHEGQELATSTALASMTASIPPTARLPNS